MATIQADEDLRRYAAGETTLEDLRRHGFGSYLTILAGLGRLGLKPPVTPLDGENADMRRRGRAIIAERIRSA